MLDWLTVTSFEESFPDFWHGKLKTEGGTTEPKRINQYNGYTFQLENGEAYIGEGIQKGIPHFMLRLIGQCADDLKGFVYSQVRQGFVYVSRLDLQVTEVKPDNWSQWDLLTRVKEKGRTVQWRESADKTGRYETVYVGSRYSNRFTRVYVKRASTSRNNTTYLLRFETEYKKARSNAIIRAIAIDGEIPDNFLRHELQTTIADEACTLLFEPALLGQKARNIRIKVVDSDEKTAIWLLEQVLPAFQRVINSHAHYRTAVISEFEDSLNKATRDITSD